jgi:hypothetical protein
LVDNAVRYGRKPELEFRCLKTAVRCGGQGRPGIPPEAAEKVFIPFYCLERSRNRATGWLRTDVGPGGGFAVMVGRALFGVRRATDGQRQREYQSLPLQQEIEELEAAFPVRGLWILQLGFDDLEAARKRHAEATADFD